MATQLNEMKFGRDHGSCKRSTTLKTFARVWKSASTLLQRAGPYLLLEIVLPGGSLIALSLFVYRNWARFAQQPALS
ncbi:MAG TPA: hypothetical protein VLW55_22115 [Burkholderiaceae bacterium]|nr:hypothetical protein [Burkholderiaceae bacterium]